MTKKLLQESLETDLNVLANKLKEIQSNIDNLQSNVSITASNQKRLEIFSKLVMHKEELQFYKGSLSSLNLVLEKVKLLETEG